MKTSFADILSGIDAQGAKKLQAKLPEWAAGGCRVPGALALEQCSSGAAAEHKAALVSGVLCDLTGGLGADSLAFSRRCGKVYYFERNEELVAAAQENFLRLGATNIECSCTEITPQSCIPDCDWIYLDPARRSNTGKKVFMLQDCSPDVTTLLPLLKSKAPNIMIKLSPMADISLISNQLGEGLKEVQVVGLNGEVKELLCILQRGFQGEYSIRALELDGGEELVFRPSEEAAARQQAAAEAPAGAILFEPSAVLLKAGAFKMIGLPKLAPSTHLYIGQSPLPGKSFRILESLPFGKESFRIIAARYPKADVSARNLPLTSEELRARLKVKSGGSVHIFGADTLSGKLLIVAERI